MVSLKMKLLLIVVVWVVLVILGIILYVVSKPKQVFKDTIDGFLEKSKEKLNFTSKLIQTKIPMLSKLDCSYLKLKDGCTVKDRIDQEWCKQLGVAGVCNDESIKKMKDCVMHGVPSGSCNELLNEFKDRFEDCKTWGVPHSMCTSDVTNILRECQSYGIPFGKNKKGEIELQSCNQGSLDRALICRQHGLTWDKCDTLEKMTQECNELNIPKGLCHTTTIAEAQSGVDFGGIDNYEDDSN